MCAATSLPPGSAFTPWGLWKNLSQPDAFIVEQLARYGDPFTDRTLGKPLVISATPEAMRRIVTADPDLFEVPNAELLVPLMGELALALLLGERHRAERKLLNPHFRSERMSAYGPLIRDTTRRNTASLRTSDTIVVGERMREIAMEVIIRAIFGVANDRVKAFRDAFLELAQSVSPLFIFFKWMRRPLFGLSPWNRFYTAREHAHRLLDEEIERRTETMRQGIEQHDILAKLLSSRYDDGSALSHEQLRVHLVGMLFAGLATTSSALIWMLYHLHKDLALAERVRAEVTALGREPNPDEITQLPLLSAVCKETLRFYPIAAATPPRQVREPFEFLGYTLPEKTMISVATHRLHKREDLYPDPLRFAPERFLERNYGPFEFIAFGGGARRCLGAELALTEMKLVAATLLTDFRFSLVSDEEPREKRRGLFLAPSSDVPMVVTQRLN